MSCLFMCFRMVDFVVYIICVFCFFFFKQKTSYEMRISDWSSDVCSSDLGLQREHLLAGAVPLVLPVAGSSDDVRDRLRDVVEHRGDLGGVLEIGRASCRERVCQYV